MINFKLMVFTDYTVSLAFLVFLYGHKLFYLFYIVILKILIKRPKVEKRGKLCSKARKILGWYAVRSRRPDPGFFHFPLCSLYQVLSQGGFELMSSWSGARLSTKELASHMRLSGCQQDFLQSFLQYPVRSFLIGK
jgi:hypothetical protein